MMKMKYLSTIYVLFAIFAIATMASGTMWENQVPDFFQLGNQSQFAIPTFKPAGLSTFEIINAPYFLLSGEGFYTSAISLQPTTKKSVVAINGTGKAEIAPSLMDFSGSYENNLQYAQSKSSLRIGQGDSSTTINTPWIVK